MPRRGKAGAGRTGLRSATGRFDFPCRHRIVALWASSGEGPQIINMHCEKARRGVCRIGITMASLPACP